MFDPEAADAAHKAGVGAELSIGVGGKLLAGHQPVYGTFSVVEVSEGDFVCTGPMMKGFTQNLGKMAQLRIGDVRIVVSSIRTQPVDQSYFRQVGIEPADMNILVIKSSNLFRADFGLISSAIINVSSPAGSIEDPSKGAYRNLRDGVRLGGCGPVHKKGSIS
ncbi:MAG: MlrC C-terminal domain-containing protein [Anaerolineaceae bacterium]|nr:MlrC C-terminal domain-containing protein [Anaerolineaceae bacterium]